MALKKDEIRFRLQRFIHGGDNITDVHDVAMFMRSRSHGRWIVREVGDFLAHFDVREKRSKSQAHLHASRSSRMAHMLMDGALRKAPINLGIDGPALIERVNLFTEQRTRELTGLTKKKVIQRLTAAQARMREDHELHIDDFNLFKIIAAAHQFNELFTSDQMCAAFEAALLSEGLLQKGELYEFRRAFPLLCLYFVTRAHNCEIVLADGETAQIRAGVDDDRKLALFVSMNTDEAQWSWMMMATDLPEAEVVAPGNDPDVPSVEPNMSGPPIVREKSYWSRPLELVGRQLACIG